MSDPTPAQVQTAFTWLARVVQVVLVPLLIWFGTMLTTLEARADALESRVSVIEANRFTSGDALELYTQLTDLTATLRAIQSDISEIKLRLSGIEDRERGGV